MSTTVWTFGAVRPFSYPPHHDTTKIALNNGHESRRAELGTYGRYRVRFAVRLPVGSETNETWQAFLRARQGAYDSFLFLDPFTALYHTSTTEALGTGNGSATDFRLDMKHVKASTLLVYKDAVAQGSGWSLVGNNSAPLVRFTSAPSNGVVITATYDFYMPVSFAQDVEQGEVLGGTANVGKIVVDLEETPPGGHRA